MANIDMVNRSRGRSLVMVSAPWPAAPSAAVVIATDPERRRRGIFVRDRDLYPQLDRSIDPARALARVQQMLDARARMSADRMARAQSWAAFSVLARPPTVHGRSAATRPP